MMNKKVALVLGSGGARGMAHIGAIEELEARGYEITSIAGCSIGSMIAGMYAAGKLQDAKEWFLQVDKQLIWKMVDFSWSKNSFVKGKRIIDELKTVVPDCRIEDMRIPCAIVAADFITTEEVLFRSGSLFDAVRASISIPIFFEPVQMGDRLLIDGGILNPLPLNRVQRHEGDVLVAMDISGKDSYVISADEGAHNHIQTALTMLEHHGFDVPDKVEKGIMLLDKAWEVRRKQRAEDLTLNVNFFTLVDRMSDMQIQQNTMLSLQLTPPDVHAVMPQYAYTTFDFDRAEDIIEDGRRLMREALDRYEASVS